MSTRAEDRRLSVNAEWITKALEEAAEQIGDRPEGYIDELITRAVMCVADEQQHAERQMPINKVIAEHVEALAGLLEGFDLRRTDSEDSI